MHKNIFLTGCIHAFLSVALGAFGAHIVKDRITERLMDIYETGVDYQMFHAIALFVVAFAGFYAGDRPVIRYAGILFNIGIIVFSGSLYLLAMTDTGWLGAITPIGGVAFLAGWVCLALSLRKR